MLHIRNPIYDGHCVVRIYTRDHSGEQRNSLFCKGVGTHICYIIKDESNEEQTDEIYTWDNSVLHSALRDPRHLRAGTDGIPEHVIRRGGICAKVSGKGAHHTTYDIVNNFEEKKEIRQGSRTEDDVHDGHSDACPYRS